MLISIMKEMKWEEAYLVEKVHCLLCLFELQKSHQQRFVVFKWEQGSGRSEKGGASNGEKCLQAQ